MSVSVQLSPRLLWDGEKLTRIIRFTIGLDAIYTATLLAAECFAAVSRGAKIGTGVSAKRVSV
jgi:hypothetical protein